VDPAIELAKARYKLERKKDLGAEMDDLPLHGAEADAGQHPVHVQVQHQLAAAHHLHADLSHDPHSAAPVVVQDPTTGDVTHVQPRFKFTVLKALELSQCLGDIESPNQRQVVFVGNSQARAFYYQLINLLLTSRHQPLQPTSRQDQKALCAESLMANHDKLSELNGDNLTPSCPIVLPHVKYYYVQEFYDPVLEHIFSSRPHMIFMIGVGLLDVLDSSTAISREFHGQESSLQSHPPARGASRPCRSRHSARASTSPRMLRRRPRRAKSS
jgi:hypothetical protein